MEGGREHHFVRFEVFRKSYFYATEIFKMYFILQSLYIFDKVKNNSYPKLITKSCSINIFNHKIIFSQRFFYCSQNILSHLPSVSAAPALSSGKLLTLLAHHHTGKGSLSL